MSDGSTALEPVAARHRERLSSVDAALFAVERPSLPMHVGSLLVFDAPPDPGDARASGFARFLDLVASRLHRVPRYRQKLVTPPLKLGGPVWVDDPEFDLSYHVRHAALPRPGTTAQLTEYAARILSRPLDRDRPLWELYVIEGLEDGRFALLGKSHQAVIDGRSGVDLVTVVLDRTPGGADQLPAPRPWRAHDAPSSSSLAVDAVRDLASSPRALVDAGRRVVDAPLRTAARAVEVGRGVANVARANVLRPAPRSPLNRPPGRSRRFAIQRIALADVTRVKDTFRTTVNDVVLAAVADATGRYLRSHEHRTDGRWLRGMVPVATRQGADEHALGNRVVPVLVDLPMAEMDPVERLRICQDAMSEVRSSHRAVGASFLIGMSEFSPPTIHAMAARAAVRSRLYNFLVANVPGPQVPVYCLGAELLGAFPFTPLAATQSYAVGLTSTAGWLNAGFTADHFAIPDLERVTGFLVDAVRELVTSAEAAGARGELSRPRPGGGGSGA